MQKMTTIFYNGEPFEVPMYLVDMIEYPADIQYIQLMILNRKKEVIVLDKVS